MMHTPVGQIVGGPPASVVTLRPRTDWASDQESSDYWCQDSSGQSQSSSPVWRRVPRRKWPPVPARARKDADDSLTNSPRGKGTVAMELDSASAARPPGERSDEKPAGKKAEKEDSKRPEVTNVLFDPESPISSWEADYEGDDDSDPNAWFMDEGGAHEDDE